MAILLFGLLAAVLALGRKPLLAGGAAGKAAYVAIAFIFVSGLVLLAIERLEGMGGQPA
ncbi:MAG: hypothetical protein AAFP99_02550 [Pseudomonadota bacterium]